MNRQIYVFSLCVLCGMAAGAAYGIVARLRSRVKNKFFNAASDVLFAVLFAVWFVFVSVLFSFPDFRLYMPLGCGVGLLFYRKSVHIILDFFRKRLYNRKKQPSDKKGKG